MTVALNEEGEGLMHRLLLPIYIKEVEGNFPHQSIIYQKRSRTR